MKTIFLLVTTFAAATSAFAGKLVIKGSDTLGAKLVPTLAEEYRARHPEVSFEIAAEGSTTGIAAVIDGTAHIGMSSRQAKATEVSAARARGVALKPTIIAHDAMAVIVNAGNTLAKLNRRQVEQIFTGDIKDWSAVGGKPGKISIYTRNTASGTYSDWKDLAMKKRDYSPAAQKMAGNEQIAAEVARNPNGIGYVGLAYLETPGTRVIAIDGVTPSTENVRNGKYPYARPTYYYTNGEPSGEAGRFIAFTLDDVGQTIVERIGFVPRQ